MRNLPVARIYLFFAEVNRLRPGHFQSLARYMLAVVSIDLSRMRSRKYAATNVSFIVALCTV